MSRPEFDPTGDPPALSPELRELVELARAQKCDAAGVSFDNVRDELDRGRQRATWVVVGLAAAAVLAVVLWPHAAGKTQALSENVPVVSENRPTPAPVPTQPAAPTDSRSEATGDQLALGVTVSPQDKAIGRVHAEGAWSVRVEGNTVFEIETPRGDSPLEVAVGTRWLAVAGDSRVSLNVQHETFTVHRGSAAWAGVEQEPTSSAAESEPSRLADRPVTAEALAIRAEAQMAAGQRRAAMRTLERLTTRYPRSAFTKSGLVDLARLYKAAGSPAKARCAYALHLRQWPASSLRTEVRRAMDALGEGPACNGLRPQTL